MDNLLPENEYKEFEGRYYVNPNVALDEGNQFIENLRAVQGQQNQEIARQTHDLGTDISSNLGGLGANTTNNLGYFTSRYQTPQTATAVADLRATAQAAALNEALANEQEMWKKRYNDAYRNYQRKQYNKANSGSGSGSSGGSGSGDGASDITTQATEEGTRLQSLRSSGPGTTTIGNLSTDVATGEPGYDVYDTATGQRISTNSGGGTTSSTDWLSGAGEWAGNTALQVAKTLTDVAPWITPIRIMTGL